MGDDQLLVGGVVNPFVLWLESGSEGALEGMLCFFWRYPLSDLCFGTFLIRFMDDIALAVPDITCVLAVPSFVCSRVGSGGFLGEALLLRGFHGLQGILSRRGLGSCGLIYVS